MESIRSRTRDLLVSVTLLYIGAALIGAPYFLRTIYPELLVTLGTVTVTAGIVSFWAARLERRISAIADTQARTSEFGVTEVGIADKNNFAQVLRKVDPRDPMFVLNRDDSR